jgi:ABC-type nitrate/sulfonate/bicarbonate transport system substrate-binding protein
MKKLIIALDWTANTNHTGFYVAQQKGFYKGMGIDLEIQTPDQDNYAITPAKKVEQGKVDFALCPFESVISYRTKTTPFDAVALATIFKEDISAIATLENENIKGPKDLDGLVYASYKARYEDKMVKQMVKNDGGKGKFDIIYPEKLGIWETIIKGEADATWIFTNWEGIRAKNEGFQLNLFKMADYGIPYGYSPIILTSKTAVTENSQCYSNFLKATKMGYIYAQSHLTEAVDIIAPYLAEQDKNIDWQESQKFTAPYYGNEQNWGLIEEENVILFLDWLTSNNLIDGTLTYKELVHTF